MNYETTKAAVHQWFFGYVDTFVRLARGGSGDAEPLLQYFHAPLSFVTDGAFVLTEKREQIGAFLGRELSQLAQSDYGDSRAIDVDLQVYNQRSAAMAVTWVRSNRSGAEFQRVRVTYWIANTAAGWRIVSMAVHGQSAQ